MRGIFCSIEGELKSEISRIRAATRSNNYIVLYLKVQQINFIPLKLDVDRLEFIKHRIYGHAKFDFLGFALNLLLNPPDSADESLIRVKFK